MKILIINKMDQPMDKKNGCLSHNIYSALKGVSSQSKKKIKIKNLNSN